MCSVYKKLRNWPNTPTCSGWQATFLLATQNATWITLNIKPSWDLRGLRPSIHTNSNQEIQPYRRIFLSFNALETCVWTIQITLKWVERVDQWKFLFSTQFSYLRNNLFHIIDAILNPIQMFITLSKGWYDMVFLSLTRAILPERWYITYQK